MAVVEKDKGKMVEKKDEKEKKTIYRVFPEISRRLNNQDKLVEVEIALPGVKKKDISLKALPLWFHIDAKKGELEYSANSDWGIEIVPEKTTAKYDNGLLRVTAHIKDPFADAVLVKL